MADCTKTVDFLREWKRLCDTHFSCKKCPMAQINTPKSAYTCRGCIFDKVEDAIAIVQRWSDEHPVWTWERELMELLPNADWFAVISNKCPGHFFGAEAPKKPLVGRCEINCRDCWNGEYKEPKT